jgi:hypothetical protein
MASDVDICNMALSHIGSDAIVSSISPVDGSVESGHCARFYPQARVELLEAHSWRFARKRETLAELATNPSDVWAYAYGLPSDMLVPLRVLSSFVLVEAGYLAAGAIATPSELALINERGSADFDIEGTTLFTNEPEAVLLYRRDITDTSKFTGSFRTALSYLLASFLAGPLIKGSEGAKTGGQLRQVATQVAAAAMALDANSGSESASIASESIRARA